MLQKTNLIDISSNPKALFEDFDAVVVLCSKVDIEIIRTKSSDFIVRDNIFISSMLQKIDEAEFDGKAGDFVVTNFYSQTKNKSIPFVLAGSNKKDGEDFVPSSIGLEAASRIVKAAKILLLPNFIDRESELNRKDIVSVALGIVEGKYNFSTYITDLKKKNKASFTKEVVIRSDLDDNAIKEAKALAESVFMVRDLINTPPNVLFPESYADFISATFKDVPSVDVEIFDEKHLEKIGMNMLLAVGQASIKKPRVVILKYLGNQKSKNIDLCVVGKGVTFDSGGLSLKPANYMMDMKTDMAGSATVVGVIKALSSQHIPVNIIGAVGLVENAVGSNAQRPGDIVKSLSGQTVEVLNTDAEGRLVLGDVLTYCVKKYSPAHIIDFATLTGAILVALGTNYAGLFSNNDELSKNIVAAGAKTGEKVFRLPMASCYDKMIDSSIADMKNISNTGQAGSITAAQFLKRFIDGHPSWAHVDIAGTAYLDKNDTSSYRRGATGFGVKLVNELIKNSIVSKS